MDEKVTLDQVQTAIDGIIEKYSTDFYPFLVKESGGGYQFLTKKDFHKTVAQLNGEKFLKRLSTAALETLAIIAYKQPITKSEIEAIRGVNCDYSIQKLLEKELIMITGRNENMPGKPLLYVTSKSFMDYFGLNTADDLPKLKEIFSDIVQPTVISDMPRQEESSENPEKKDEEETDEFSSSVLAVSENGELVEDSNESGPDENAGQ